MKSHKLVTKITFRVYTKNGKLKSKKSFVSHSWVRGFFWLWAAQTSQTIRTPPANFFTNDTTTTIREGNKVFGLHQGTLNLTGIMVGTSSQAVNADDNKLIAIILDGNGAGQFQYGSVNIGNPDDPVIGGVITMKVNRSFTNASGGSVTVREVGLYQSSDIDSEQVLTERSLKTQAVLDTEILNVEYDFTETV